MKAKQKSSFPLSLTTDVKEHSKQFLIAQYSALKEEILRRMEVQNQIISLMFIASGTLISVGLQFSSTTIILATPILSIFLATFWANHDVRIRQIGLYIKKYIEEEFLEVDKGWEGVGGTNGTKHLARQLAILASQGIFVGIQILALFMALLKATFKTEEIILMILDIFIILITLLLLRRRPVVV